MKIPWLSLGASLLAMQAGISAAEPADYVAHEWGTFTSVQGADGIQLEWNPLLTTELPQFVHDRGRPRTGRASIAVLAGKTALVARQRLETPVIYFYSKEARTVDVTVHFPDGSVTEWYPQQDPLPGGIVRAGQPAARWQHLRIAAPTETIPAFLRETAGSHYYAARETDANAIQIPGRGADGKPEWEKFLFYRGVGAFEAPLKVTLGGADGTDICLTNTGSEELRDLFLCQSDGREIAVQKIERIPPGGAWPAEINALARRTGSRKQLAADLGAALVRAGLYEAEAAAMVKTWDDSWLGEPGLRVLYLLPRDWADRVLPLALNPAPREIARVMVGRAEMLTPAIERALTREVERFRTGDETVRAAAIAAVRGLGLGRFAEPAVRRLALAQPTNREFNTAAWELIWAAVGPRPAPAVAQQHP